MLSNPQRKQLTSAFRVFLAKCSLSLFRSATLSAHYGDVDSVARRCIWGLWWTKWQYDGVSPSTLAICCQLSRHQCFIFVYLPSGAAVRMKSQPTLSKNAQLRKFHGRPVTDVTGICNCTVLWRSLINLYVTTPFILRWICCWLVLGLCPVRTSNKTLPIWPKVLWYSSTALE